MKKFSNGIKLSKLQKILFFKNSMIPHTKINISIAIISNMIHDDEIFNFSVFLLKQVMG